MITVCPYSRGKRLIFLGTRYLYEVITLIGIYVGDGRIYCTTESYLDTRILWPYISTLLLNIKALIFIQSLLSPEETIFDDMFPSCNNSPASIWYV